MKIQQSLLFLISSLFLVILISSCNKSGDKISGMTNGYVVNHTQGIVDRNKPVFIVFNKKIDTLLFNKNNNDIIKIVPDATGEISMLGEKALRFASEEFNPNTKYKVSVDLKKIFPEIDKKNRFYSFEFQTMPIAIDISFSGLQSDGENSYSLPGLLYSNDSIDVEKIKKIWKINYTGDELPEFNYTVRNKEVKFLLKNIKREDVEKVLNISWDASGLGSDAKGKSIFYIPAKNDFKVLDYSIVNKTPTSIQINFSSPLKRNQELEGLIHFKSLKAKPEISINNNIVQLKFNKNITGDFDLIVERGVKDINGNALRTKYTNKVFLKAPMPQLKLLGDGVITPYSQSINIPFEAINLRAVDVQVTKIYSNNVLQFLQNNYLNSRYIRDEVGEVQFVKKIDLAAKGEKIDMYKWKKYALDLSDYIKVDKGAIYNIKIGFRKSYTDYICAEDNEKMFEQAGLDNPSTTERTFWRDWISYSGFEWDQRNDPCYPAYYTSDHFVQKNILATNIGLSAKKAKNGTYYVFVNDLMTSGSMSNTNVSIYSYAKQLLGQKKTNDNGIAIFDFKDKKPYFVVASNGEDFAYLPMKGRMALSVSEFDVGGSNKNSDIDGFIYGERGVWRPGDSLFLSFILSRGESDLPEDHPVQFEMKDPFGKSYYKTSTSQHVGDIYSFITKTESSAPTGNWMAIVKVGNNEFYKKIKIETVKPNRLKIKIDFKEKKYLKLSSRGFIDVKWLNGLPAGGVNVRIDASLKNKSPEFKGYKKYKFYDMARYFENNELSVLDDYLDDDGTGIFNLTLDKNNYYPGMIKANFKVKAFEKSGDFSSDYFTKIISPYKEYVGIDFPKSKWGDYEIKRNKDNKVSFVVVDSDGKPVANRKIEVNLYNAEWRWWWDNSARDIANYLSDMSIRSFKKIKLVTDANGIATTNIKIQDWGAYLLRACDMASGHCSSILFYSGYYGGDSDKSDFANKLKFQLDKKFYNIGEKAKISIPAGSGNKVIIAIEKDGDIKETTWQNSTGDVFEYDLDIEKWMFPNVYVHVSVLKPAGDTENDLPLRRYGIVPIIVSDPDKKLIPVVDVPDKIKPESEYTIKVREKNKKPMAYTIAVVDDGLLDLTHFKTPSPYDHFFAKSASGVSSWDIYNFVQKSSKIFFDKIISLGGDDEMEGEEGAKKANRFVPVVRYIGPFYLKKGKTNTHKLKMQNYSGSVRVMVVAAGDNRYGSFEKSVKVKDELMLLPTAPRVLSPGETFEVPVTVFATSDKIHNVNVVLHTNEFFEIEGVKNTQLNFSKPGEKLAYFKVKVNEKLGVGTLDFDVNSGKFSAKKHIEISVDNPNPLTRKIKFLTLKGGEKQEFSIEKFGMSGTNSAKVEISILPKLNIEKKLQYLLHYPYGCIEQTTSTAFPLVFLNDMIEMSPERRDKINNIIIATIKRLGKFQLNNGGFSYWPGESYVSDWGTDYATHFLIEAQNSGYDVYDLLDNSLKYIQKRSASKINTKNNYQIIDLSYQLMLLAKAGKPNRASMNYMRNNVKLPVLAKWYLAIAYTYTGDNDIANELYNKGDNIVKDYIDVYYNYGSKLRDYSVKLLLLNRLGMKKESALLVKDIIEEFNSGWHNTQATAYSLIALSKYMKNTSSGLNFAIGTGQNIKNVKLDKPVYSFDIDEKNMDKNYFIENKNKKSVIFVNIISVGKPLQSTEQKESSNLDMNIVYLDKNNNILDIHNLKMGQEFKAVVNLKRLNGIKDYRNLAVNQVFPSGWEILNWRMGNADNNSTYYIRYQDIRDDRVYSFLDMNYQTKTGKIEIPLVATYPGRYYMPVQYAESMYDNSIFAKNSATWVEVKR